MGWWEELVLHVDYKQELKTHVQHWYRYIDDLFIIWQGTSDEAERFIQRLNINNLNLNFTATLSQTSINFLDVELYVNDNVLHTRLHRKSTAVNAVVHASSAHPPHLIHSITYGEMLRLRRICSNDIDCRLAQQESKQRFLERGYSVKCIIAAIEKSLKISRLDLLTGKQSSSESENQDTEFQVYFWL